MGKRQNGLPKKTRDVFKKLPVGARVKVLVNARKVLGEQNSAMQGKY